MKKHKLYRSKKRILAGVCGGLGEYFGIDPTLVRFIWALVTIFTGFLLGIIAYIVSWFIIPEH